MKKANSIPVSEKDLARSVDDYLQIGQNQGKWIFFILPSGSAFVWKGKRFYKIKLNEEGTSDRLVIRYVKCYPESFTQVIFLELKSAKGKQRKEQKAFQIIAENTGALYHIIRNIEQLMEVLK